MQQRICPKDKVAKEIMWSECQDYAYGLKSDFASKEEFVETVTRQYDNAPCVVKNIKIEPCLFTGEEIYPDVLIPLSLTDIVIENYYTAEVEEIDEPEEPDEVPLDDVIEIHPDGSRSSPEIATMHQDGTLCNQCGTYIGEATGEARVCKGCEL